MTWRESTYSRSVCAIGRGRRNNASTSRNAATQLPIASPSDSTAAAVVTLRFISCRHPKRTSAASDSTKGSPLSSRCMVRACSTPPSLIRASRRASSAVAPLRIISSSSSCRGAASSRSISASARSPLNIALTCRIIRRMLFILGTPRSTAVPPDPSSAATGPSLHQVPLRPPSSSHRTSPRGCSPSAPTHLRSTHTAPVAPAPDTAFPGSGSAASLTLAPAVSQSVMHVAAPSPPASAAQSCPAPLLQLHSLAAHLHCLLPSCHHAPRSSPYLSLLDSQVNRPLNPPVSSLECQVDCGCRLTGEPLCVFHSFIK